jgi:hypothetical protein
MHSTCPAHLIPLDFITRIIFMMSTIYGVPHYIFFSSLRIISHPFCPNSQNTVLKNLSPCSSLNVKDQVVIVIVREKVKGKAIPYTRPWRPIGLWDVEGLTVSRQSAHRWRYGCQPYAPAALHPPGWFLVLISVRGWVDPRAIVRLEGRKIPPLRDSNLRPSGLYRSASTNYATACPYFQGIVTLENSVTSARIFFSSGS